jgi:hypothetical protein
MRWVSLAFWVRSSGFIDFDPVTVRAQDRARAGGPKANREAFTAGMRLADEVGREGRDARR